MPFSRYNLNLNLIYSSYSHTNLSVEVLILQITSSPAAPEAQVYYCSLHPLINEPFSFTCETGSYIMISQERIYGYIEMKLIFFRATVFFEFELRHALIF